ncbi:MAG TPA: YciI family protein [Polyangiaceae bacterium]|nr:YciI family protein [Polyangiaceae bacterium]
MAHLLLMVEPIGQRESRTEAEGREAYARMVGWAESLHQRGLLIAAESLRSPSSASRLQVRAGRTHVIDGPFPETKEMIGGFFLINCRTQQEALAIAGECPAAEWLTVEVRAVAACFEESQAASQ